MSDVSGIPNLGFGGGSYFANPSSGLANAYASQAQTNAYLANQQRTLAQANSFNPFANSGGSFGAQPAAYAALGAAYGRAGGGGPNYQRRMGSGGIGSDAARAPSQPPMGSTFQQSSYPAGLVTRGPRLPPAGRGDPYFMDSNPAGFNPSLNGGIGSDMRYGRQNNPDFDQIWHRALPLYMPAMPQEPIPPVSPLPQQGTLGYQPTVSS